MCLFADRRKNFEYLDMPNAINHKILSRPKASSTQDVATERHRIIVDAFLTQTLKRVAGVWIATKPRDLPSKVVPETDSAPTEM